MKPISNFAIVLGLFDGLLPGQAKPPKLDLAFELHLELGKPTDVGQIGPAGSRRIVPVAGGTLQGPGLKGKIMPGADYQIIHPDGLVELDAHYVVQMENGDRFTSQIAGCATVRPRCLRGSMPGRKWTNP